MTADGDDELHDLVPDHPCPYTALAAAVRRAQGLDSPTLIIRNSAVNACANIPTQGVGAVYGPAEERRDLAVLGRIEESLTEPRVAMDDVAVMRARTPRRGSYAKDRELRQAWAIFLHAFGPKSTRGCRAR